MYLHKKTNASYGFFAPEVQAHSDKLIEVPFPAAESIVVAIADDVAEIPVNVQTTVVDLGTSPANTSVNAAISKDIATGATLTVKVKGTGTEVVSFGVGFLGGSIINAAGKTSAISFIYDGTGFIPTGAAVQLN